MKTRNLLLIIIITILITSCTKKQNQKELKTRESAVQIQKYIEEINHNRETALVRYVESMPLEQKIAQMFIENLEGNVKFRSYETVGAMTGKKDDTPLVAGGYLFFSYNIADSRELMKSYIDSVREYCYRYGIIQPYLCVDQEGGWVNRLKRLNPPLASNEAVAGQFDVGQAYKVYCEQAAAMKELGFDMNLAPVVEICTEDNKEFLDGRSFGNVQQVIDYGTACINAYENNSIATVIKHFPGNTNTDPHTGLPEIQLSLEELEKSIVSFKELVKLEPKAVLMSHARTQAVDKGVPACLSSVWVTAILRNEFGYKGLIFSDDIFMGALADNGYPPEVAACSAVEAGVDCIMISEKRFAKAGAVLYKKARSNSDFAKKIDNAVIRILKYKIKAGLFDETKIW